MPLDTNNAARLKEKVEIVITRGCRAKKDDESKIKKYAAGDEDIFIRKYADELLSMNKAVIKGSLAHKANADRIKKAVKVVEKPKAKE